MGGKAGRKLRVLQLEIAACEICVPELPLGPRPVLQFSSSSSIVIVGQAPGTKVHATGIPWDDLSGDHLREWLGIDKPLFYDPRHFALVPMSFCYPGKSEGGDAPPRKECAPAWHSNVLKTLPADRLIILSGLYAQRYYLGKSMQPTLTETVRDFEDYLPTYFPLPHPSWRSRIWMKKNPWFAQQVLPALRAQVAERTSEAGNESPGI